jgi:hypothetical protein
MCFLLKKKILIQDTCRRENNVIINIHDKWDYIKPNITTLIASTEDYFVIIDKEIMIDWETSDDFDTKNSIYKDKINELKNRIFALECEPIEYHDDIVKYNYISMLGEALSRVFDLDFDSAHIMIDKANEFIKNRNIELSRIWTLETSFFIIPIVCVSIIIMGALAFYNLVDITAFTSEIIMCTLIGGLSAIISLVLRLGTLQYYYFTARRAHTYECIAKTIIGFMSGSLIYIMIKAGIILPFINDLSSAHTLYFIFIAFIAGATERLIPSIISTYKLSKKED